MYGVFEQNKKQIIKKMLIYVEINLCTTSHVSGGISVGSWTFCGGFFFFFFFPASVGKAISDQFCMVPRLQIR